MGELPFADLELEPEIVALYIVLVKYTVHFLQYTVDRSIHSSSYGA